MVNALEVCPSPSPYPWLCPVVLAAVVVAGGVAPVDAPFAAGVPADARFAVDAVAEAPVDAPFAAGVPADARLAADAAGDCRSVADSPAEPKEADRCVRSRGGCCLPEGWVVHLAAQRLADRC